MLNILRWKSHGNFILNVLKAKNFKPQQQQQGLHRKIKWRPARKMHRIWETNDTECHQQFLTDGGKQYTLLSYNILAQDLLTEHLYLYVDIPPQMLRWEHRLHRLKEEILNINPDILCLQEMQYNHLKTLVKTIRGERQLEYVFKKKTGHRTDGCAIIYDKSKFKLLEELGVEYHTPDVATLNRENIALLAKFNLREDPTRHLVVATTHLLYNPRRSDVRMAQVNKLLQALHTFAVHKKIDSENEVALPIILTGDFNAVPNSSPYEVLTAPNTQAVPSSTTPETQVINDQELNSPVKYLKSTPKASNVKESSQLQMLPLNFGKKVASTLQNTWIVVDFILHSIDSNRDEIKTWSIYRLPTISDCMDTGKIPNKFYGSDHYSLGVVFSVV